MALNSKSDFVNVAPHAPGVYVMKDSRGTVIYVGKAKDLKNRIRNYFVNKKLDSKTLKLVEQVADVEFILTSNETEALILESNLIKKFKGKYNVELKDSYRYPFVQITNEEFPRIIVVRAPKKNFKQSDRVFGPFVDGQARHQMIDLVEKAFQLRTCKKLPLQACLKYYLGQCTAPCIGRATMEEYALQVQKAVDFFSGNREELIGKLEAEMLDLSKKRLFELALQKRDAIASLSGRKETQVVETFRRKDQDFLAVAKTPSGIKILVLPFRRGTLLGKQVFSFESKLVSTDILEDFLLEYYGQNQPPHEIVVRQIVSRFVEIEKILSDASGHSVSIKTKVSGDAKAKLEIAEKNLLYALNPTSDPLSELQNRLVLPQKPVRLECFDISHFAGNQTVASMVVFENGKPNKSNYRRFLIQTASRGDDYAAMSEVVLRRYTGSLSKDLPKPDLIVLDGGKGQLSVGLQVLKKHQLSIPMIGLAKKNEEIFIPALSTPIVLDRKNPGLQVLIRLRDEAHRFANAYRKTRVKKQIPK